MGESACATACAFFRCVRCASVVPLRFSGRNHESMNPRISNESTNPRIHESLATIASPAPRSARHKLLPSIEEDGARSPIARRRSKVAGERGHLVDADELLRRLRGEQHIAPHFFLGDAARPRGIGIWRSTSGVAVAGAERVDGDSPARPLPAPRSWSGRRCHVGGDIGGLERAGDQRAPRRC